MCERNLKLIQLFATFHYISPTLERERASLLQYGADTHTLQPVPTSLLLTKISPSDAFGRLGPFSLLSSVIYLGALEMKCLTIELISKHLLHYPIFPVVILPPRL